MKKKLVFLLTVCLFFELSDAQDNFTVIKVSGNIVIERTGSSLTQGTAFSQNENLLFKIPESRAAVINPQRGRFLLTSDNLTEFRTSKSNFLPPTGKISTRAFGTTSKPEDIKTVLLGNIAILNDIKIVIDTSVYPLADDKFFYVSYGYNNKTINKKLSFNKDTLLIKKNELLLVDGKVIQNPDIKEMKLTYLAAGDPYISTPVSTFTPVFPDNDLLKQELKILISQMSTRTYNEKISEISSYLQDFYGKVDENSLKIWLNKNLGFKK
jgi:hypothetical protein